MYFCVDVAALQETHFVWKVDVNDYVVYLAHEDHLARGVSLVVKRTLDTKVELVHVDARGWESLIVADIAVNSSFQVVAVYAPND